MTSQTILTIGKKIREIRHQQDLTLQEIAESAQISKGLLSKIENGRTIPSLPVLLEVIAALQTDMSAFFEGVELENNRRYMLIKKTEYMPFEKENRAGFIYHSVFSQNMPGSLMDVALLELAPGPQQKQVTTDGFELKYLLKGKVVYMLGRDRVEMEEGDTLFFDGKIPHVPVNLSREAALMLIVYFLTPPNESPLTPEGGTLPGIS
jgi:transcriptional regulator with XRE-family HTH domain